MGCAYVCLIVFFPSHSHLFWSTEKHSASVHHRRDSGDHLRQFSVLDFINLSITHDSKRTAQYDTIWNAANGPFPVVMLRGRGGRSQGYYSIARHHIAPPTRPVRSCTGSDPPSPSASLLMALFAMEIVIVAPACELPS